MSFTIETILSILSAIVTAIIAVITWFFNRKQKRLEKEIQSMKAEYEPLLALDADYEIQSTENPFLLLKIKAKNTGNVSLSIVSTKISLKTINGDLNFDNQKSIEGGTSDSYSITNIFEYLQTKKLDPMVELSEDVYAFSTFEHSFYHNSETGEEEYDREIELKEYWVIRKKQFSKKIINKLEKIHDKYRLNEEKNGYLIIPIKGHGLFELNCEIKYLPVKYYEWSGEIINKNYLDAQLERTLIESKNELLNYKVDELGYIIEKEEIQRTLKEEIEKRLSDDVELEDEELENEKSEDEGSVLVHILELPTSEYSTIKYI